MFKLMCVTNRKLCTDNFYDRIEELCRNDVDVILREKDLSEKEYEMMTEKILKVCPDVIAHTYTRAAENLKIKKIHLPLDSMNKDIKKIFNLAGVSVHSVEEAVKAEQMGADYITAGHVFETDCKKGFAPRGTVFLESVVHAVNIPVYGIGGISPDNIGEIKKTGAAGACIMSGFMRCESVDKYLTKLNTIL